MDLIYTIVVTLFTLGVLVTVHEFGHFWVARRCGVMVHRFSIGFGTPLLRWTDKQGTEFVIAAIPLGGYVKMLDERAEDVTPGMEQFAFNRKPVLQRIAVVAAGPLANLLLAVLAYWFVFLSGESGLVPVIGKVVEGSVAELAGLEAGQEIVAVDGRETPTWEAVNFRLLDRIGDSGSLLISVRYPDSDMEYQQQAILNKWMSDAQEPNLLAGLGVETYRPPIPALLNEVLPDSPALRAGLQSGDLIVSADGLAMSIWDDWVKYVRARPNETLALTYEREGRRYETLLTPASKESPSGERFGQVGVSVQVPPWPDSMVRQYSYGPVDALGRAIGRTSEMVSFTFAAIKKMITGLISPKNLSGPITIAKVATASAESGLESYIAFMALLSVSLGVLNLLPVPVLDGGHLLYYTIELLVGKPVPLKIQAVGYQVGLFVILGVMMLALYNDFSRL